jgi:hypothetical protein
MIVKNQNASALGKLRLPLRSTEAAAFSVVLCTVRAFECGWCFAPSAGPLQVAKYG